MARHTEDSADFPTDFPADLDDGAEAVCPLCNRPIPPDVPQSLHHLVPKAKGGKRSPQALLHEICHLEIHASLSDTDLAHKFNTIEALQAHPRLAKFIEWVSKRPPGFQAPLPGKKGGRLKG